MTDRGYLMRRGLTVVLAACMIASGAVTARAGIPMEKVVGGPGTQYNPSSNGTFVAFSEYRHRTYNAIVMNETTGHRRRANAAGERGVMGSFIQGTSQFVFQQYDGTSNLYFFDTATGRRTPAPSKVNGLGWVYWPVGSTDYLLYMRATHRFHTRSLVLYDRAAKTNRVLIPDIGGKGVLPGFVGSQYAAWLTCGSQACNDYVYDIGTKELWKVPAPDGRSTFSPTIDEATDQLYFVRSSSDRCGVAVTIRVATIGSDDSTVLASLPRGVDTGSMMSLTANPGSGFQDLYFMRWDCRDQRGDVFAIRSIDDVVMRGGRTLGPVPSGRYRPVPRSFPVAGSVPG